MISRIEVSINSNGDLIDAIRLSYLQSTEEDDEIQEAQQKMWLGHHNPEKNELYSTNLSTCGRIKSIIYPNMESEETRLQFFKIET